jgi:hypothetical protein
MSRGAYLLTPGRRPQRAPAAAGGGGGFSPEDLGFTWWDPTDASSFTFGTGSAVASWVSQDAAATLSQSTSGERPTRSTTLNGLSTVLFTAASSQWLTSDLSSKSQPFTYFVVVDGAGDGGTEVPLGGACLHWNVGGNEFKFYAGSDGATSIPVTGAHYWIGTINGATTTIYKDGVDTSFPNNPGTNAWSGMVAGRRSSSQAEWYLDGSLGDIGFVSGTLASGDRDDLASWLSDRWAI